MTDTNQEVRETPEALRAFSDAATPGQAWCDGDTADVYFCDPPGSSFRPDSVLVARCATGDDYKRNARFIAECVNHVRAALASAPPPAVPDAVGVRDCHLDTRLDSEKAKEWPAAKKALWRVVTGEKLNDGHYINAWRLTDKLYTALCAIEPTPSPEPQASNAGAVEPVAWRWRYYDSGPARPWYVRQSPVAPEEPSPGYAGVEVQPLYAALLTPGPQTGERDKAIHDIAEAIGLGRNMCDDDGGGSTDLDVFRQAFFALDAVEQMLLAERAARKAAERRLAEEVEMHRYTEKRRQDWQAEASKQNERAEAAERRLADVEERAREDERDRLRVLALRKGAYDAECFLIQHDGLLPADRAALRAKPEAQAIMGMEVGE